MIVRLGDIPVRHLASGKPVQLIAGVDDAFTHLSAGVTTLTHGQVSGPAVHDGDEIQLILSGVVRVEVGDEVAEASEMTALAIPGGTRHRMQALSNSATYLWVLAPIDETTTLRLVEALASSDVETKA